MTTRQSSSLVRRGVQWTRRMSRAGARLAVVAAAGLIVLSLNACGAPGDAADMEASRFFDVEAQTREFIGYNKSIELTPEQAEVKAQALSAFPAPCCSDNSAEVCCCPCNMAQSGWGLAKHLIVDEGYGVEEVRAEVQEWYEFINPDGFSGDVCYTAGCNRAFHENGCGGMSDRHIVF